MTKSHEELYTRTVDTLITNVERGSFTEQAVPHLIEQLRTELGQCVELGLISSAFYAERMQVLGNVMAVL